MNYLRIRKSAVFKALLAGLLAIGSLSSAEAGDGSGTGKISRLDAVSSLAGAPGNGDTRVYIPGASFCTGAADASWAFINSNDTNYKGVLSTMMMAFMASKTITVNARAVPFGNTTFCQITWVNVFD